MILYLYAIADGLGRLDDVPGAEGEPLTLHAVEGMEVVAGERAALPIVDAAALSAQDAVVRALHARAAALLPVRFGAALSSKAEMEQRMALRAPALRERLAVVRGREQMTLRVVTSGASSASGALGASSASSASGASGASGAAYLRERAAKAVPREVLPLLDALHAMQRATRVEAGRSAGVVATVYQLIDRGSSAEYEAAARTAASALPSLSIRVSGPAPCYAFT